MNAQLEDMAFNLTYRNMALGFAACAHKDQKRKYTGEPYFMHCNAVAQIVSEYTGNHAAVAAAALHDTIEDTSVTKEDLLLFFGAAITDLVLEVTDVSRPEDGNRAKRKKIDREHLANSSFFGATIKLADIIDNTSSIVKYDKDFARIYLPEKEAVMAVLKHGHSALYARARDVLHDAYKAIGIIGRPQV